MNYNPADTQMPDEASTQGIDSLAPQPNPNVTLSTQNFAETLDEAELQEVSERCKRGYELDRGSREDWENEVEEWLKLANQIREVKSYPWRNASNIKYPLLSTAAMQFAARAYPALVPSNGKVVNNKVVGKDPTGQKLEKADRVSTYMSYQLLQEIPGWEEDMDRMLMMLPVVGTVFKKTWYDKSCDRIRSEVILPKNVVVNYWTKNLHECERISEVILMSPRILKEKQNAGVYLEADLGDAQTPTNVDNKASTTVDDTTPYTLIEQHTFHDLDNDGYDEPYIVTFEETSGKILRIQARYRQEDIEFKDDGKTIKRIKPLQMYTKFGFVPNPDGSFYDIGFGILLGPLNESVNTLINVLVDSGHLSTLQAGFIGKGLRMKMGDSKFQPGEWKQVSATGDDLRKQIVPLPLKEPSNVLFQLLGTLITSGKELASVAEIFTGKMPGQNTPATTTMATVEQGMKVFTAVYKRIYRALAEEFDKIFDLNALYTDPNHMVMVLDIQIGPEDFDRASCDITPGADPTAISQTEKLMKAQGLMELLQAAGPMLDPVKVISRILDAQEQPNWQDLFSEQVKQTGQVPPPPPDPKVLALQAKIQADQQTAAIKTAAMQQQGELDARSKEQQLLMDAQAHQQKMQFNEEEAQSRVQSQVANTQVKLATTLAQVQQASQQKAQTHQQQMQHKQESQILALSQKAKSANGGKAK
jgi:chaperonin GroES